MFKLLLLSLLVICQVNLNYSMPCPDGCTCKWITANLKVDCSNLGISELPDFGDIPIEILDLSNNLLMEFPSQLSRIQSLMNLDLSGNLISFMDPASLAGFTSLNILLLNENNISNWRDINPNRVLLPAMNLHTLSLAGNPLNTFSSGSEDLLLMSNSLKLLDLSDCKITKVSGRFILQGLTNLERLILNGNPLRTYSQFVSNSLRILDLSNCGLTKLHSNSFIDLYILNSIDLSHNPGLTLIPKPGEYVKSETVKRLDISYCNMDSVELSGFPNLINLNLKGNMLKILTHTTFESNGLLENLDLSNNAIAEIGPGTFTSLKNLKRLDLSYNTLARIDRNTFIENDMLINLNLSRNFISRLSKISSNSLGRLDLSGCEILAVDQNALNGLPKLIELNLSHNLMSHFPASMVSLSLESLDLSMCRLTSIRNTTFRYIPNLVSLKLSGNRFTTPFRTEYFKENKYLHEIWLGDNPWRCECEDTSFMQFYLYLTQRPAKINDKQQLKCASPDLLYGQSWEQACFRTWFQNSKISTTEKIWSISMITIIVLSVILCLVVSVKRFCENRKRRQDERELRRNLDEQREIMRQNRIMLEQEAQLNAPDPRETLPPCYEEALLMPKLERGFKSMVELNVRRSKHKSTNSKCGENDELVLDYRRFQSEEMLSVRDRERTLDVNMTRRTGNIERVHLGSRLLAAEETKFPAAYLKSQNLESAEKIANFQSYENSPYSRRKRKSMQDEEFSMVSVRADPKIVRVFPKTLESSSVEIIKSYDSIERSPYSRRKPQELYGGKTSISQWTLSSDTDKDSLAYSTSINLVEGHFSNPQSLKSSCSEFQVMDRDSPASVRSDPPVIVHQPNANESQI